MKRLKDRNNRISNRLFNGRFLHTFLFFFILSAAAGIPRQAHAYVDPGTLGNLYQMGFIAFYIVVGALAVFFRPIKNFFLRLLGRKPADPPKADETAKPGGAGASEPGAAPALTAETPSNSENKEN